MSGTEIIQNAGSIGESAGAISVIASLAYLGIRVSRNSRDRRTWHPSKRDGFALELI